MTPIYPRCSAPMQRCPEHTAMQRTDYHTHTPLCLHAEGEPEQYVARALELGMMTYGIADHAPMPPEQEPYDNWRMRCADATAYREWIDRARAAAAGKSLSILTGLECDWLPGIEPWVRRLRQEFACDYLIGSVHYLRRGESVDDSVYANRTITDSTETDWQLYWQAVTDMIQSKLFDIVGHIDLVKIWKRVPGGNLLRYYGPALDALEHSGMAVEINTAGWHKHCTEQYPGREFLQELLQRRIPIVIDSDAHCPAHLSRDWDRAVDLLQELTSGKLRQFEHPAAHNPHTILHAYGSL